MGLEGLLLITLHCVLASVSHAIEAEYCLWDTVDERCAPNEVIVFTMATFGRMKSGGKCTLRDRGSLGCGSDVLTRMDAACGGQQTCKFAVSTLHGSQACPLDLSPYLKVTYYCQAVAQCETQGCSGGDVGAGGESVLTARSGMLASAEAERSACGTPQCPWTVRAQPGQRINVTLFDFSLALAGRQKTPLCHRLASIEEEGVVTHDVTVCSGGQGRRNLRESIILTSRGNEIKIKFHTKDRPNRLHTAFLLKYEAFGCPRLEPPPYALLKARGQSAIIACNFSQQTCCAYCRYLTCDGTSWVGETGFCDPKRDDLDALQLDKQAADDNSPFGMLVVIGTGVALGVTVGIVMLVLTLLYIKRRSGRRRMPTFRKDQRPEGNYVTHGELIYTREHDYQDGGGGEAPRSYVTLTPSSVRAIPTYLYPEEDAAQRLVSPNIDLLTNKVNDSLEQEAEVQPCGCALYVTNTSVQQPLRS